MHRKVTICSILGSTEQLGAWLTLLPSYLAVLLIGDCTGCWIFVVILFTCFLGFDSLASNLVVFWSAEMHKNPRKVVCFVIHRESACMGDWLERSAKQVRRNRGRSRDMAGFA